MSNSAINPQANGPFTLIYAGSRRGAVNDTEYADAQDGIDAAEAIVGAGEKILVMGFLNRRTRIPASLVEGA